MSTGNAVLGTTSTNANVGSSTQLNGTESMDPELKGLATQMGYGTMVLKDTAILEFDFVPLVTGSFSFKYVFGSDEFPEYAPPTSKALLLASSMESLLT